MPLECGTPSHESHFVPRLRACWDLSLVLALEAKRGSGRGSCRERAWQPPRAAQARAPGVGVGRPLPTGGGGTSSTEEKTHQDLGVQGPLLLQGHPTHPHPTRQDSSLPSQCLHIHSRHPARLGVQFTLQFSPSRDEGLHQILSCVRPAAGGRTALRQGRAHTQALSSFLWHLSWEFKFQSSSFS